MKTRGGGRWSSRGRKETGPVEREKESVEERETKGEGPGQDLCGPESALAPAAAVPPRMPQ